MYPRNAASPERIAIGPVVQISDGAVQTSGVTVRVLPFGGSEADGGGTTAYSTDGVVVYTPTQAETDYTSFVLIAKKTGCIPASVTVVTSASSTAGHAGTDQSKIANATATVNLSGTAISTSQQVASVTGAVGSVTGNVGGNVLGYVGSINGVTFPSNFALLGIDGAGAILTVATVEELGVNALQANGLHTEIAVEVWAQDAGGTFPDGSLGDRVLISQNNTRAMAVTGSGHIAAVLHDAEPNSIPEDAFVDAAISARVIGTDAIDADALADGAITSGVFAADSITATALATSAGEEIADKVWDEAIAAHLASGSTGEALNNAGGSGNPWITDLSTGYTGTQAGNILNSVKVKTDLIQSGGTVNVSTPVTASGQIASPLIIGDDYLAANGRGFRWTVPLPSGFVIGTSTAKFGMRYEDEQGVNSFIKTGTVSDAGSGNVHLDFDLTKAVETGTLRPGWYEWSVEIASASGTEITRVKSGKNAEWQEKQT